jgi:hypothetical protein
VIRAASSYAGTRLWTTYLVTILATSLALVSMGASWSVQKYSQMFCRTYTANICQLKDSIPIDSALKRTKLMIIWISTYAS